MTIFLVLLKKYWKHILIVIILLLVTTYFYNKIYTRGFDAVNVACEQKLQDYAQKMKEYEASLDKRIAGLEEASNLLVTEAIESRKVLRKDFSVILSTIKNRPLYTIDQGKCAPSEDFVRVYNDAVNRANAK